MHAFLQGRLGFTGIPAVIESVLDTLGAARVHDFEALYVTDSEARTLLLTLDPLAGLATYDQEALDRLQQTAEQDSAAVKGLWQALAEADTAGRARLSGY